MPRIALFILCCLVLIASAAGMFAAMLSADGANHAHDTQALIAWLFLPLAASAGGTAFTWPARWRNF